MFTTCLSAASRRSMATDAQIIMTEVYLHHLCIGGIANNPTGRKVGIIYSYLKNFILIRNKTR